MKVCMVNTPWEADKKVYITNGWEADIKVAVVDAWEADMKVYPQELTIRWFDGSESQINL